MALAGEATVIESDVIEVGSWSLSIYYMNWSKEQTTMNLIVAHSVEDMKNLYMSKCENSFSVLRNRYVWRRIEVFNVKLIQDQPLKKTDEEIGSVAKIIADNYEDEDLRTTFLDLMLQLYMKPAVEIFQLLTFLQCDRTTFENPFSYSGDNCYKPTEIRTRRGNTLKSCYCYAAISSKRSLAGSQACLALLRWLARSSRRQWSVSCVGGVVFSGCRPTDSFFWRCE